MANTLFQEADKHSIQNHFVSSNALLCHCKNIKQLNKYVQRTIFSLGLDGCYRLDVNKTTKVEIFCAGQLLKQMNYTPHINWHQKISHILDCKKSFIFKLPYIQLCLLKSPHIIANERLYKSLLLVWAQKINNWCTLYQKNKFIS